MNRLKIIVFVLLVNASFSVFTQTLVVERQVRFLALGDSYTIGQGVAVEDRWPNQLAEALKDKGVTINELKIIAQTGWTTGDLQYVINSQNPPSNYNLVSLLIGVNNQYQGADIDDYPGEFRTLLNRAITLCSGRKEGVFVLSIPDYGVTPFGLSNREKIGDEIDAYNRINKQIASELGVAYFDITGISREALNKPEYLASDNLHPSGEMYARWVDLIVNSYKFRISTATSVEDFAYNKPMFYPNPAHENITISTKVRAKYISIYNNLGALIWQTSEDSAGSIQIDISQWRRGLYFYRIEQTDGESLSGKFLVN